MAILLLPLCHLVYIPCISTELSLQKESIYKAHKALKYIRLKTFNIKTL